MVNYKDIFEDQKSFRIINSYIDEAYKFQSNEDKGEFINQNGQVIAQLIEANPNNDWFSIAGILMGQIALKGIQYNNLTSENHIPVNFDSKT